MGHADARLVFQDRRLIVERMQDQAGHVIREEEPRDPFWTWC